RGFHVTGVQTCALPISGLQARALGRVSDSLAGTRAVSTGVGIANIRDRLAQAYGEDHRFDIDNPPEGGFTVTIEIPFELHEEARSEERRVGNGHRRARA